MAGIHDKFKAGNLMFVRKRGAKHKILVEIVHVEFVISGGMPRYEFVKKVVVRNVDTTAPDQEVPYEISAAYLQTYKQGLAGLRSSVTALRKRSDQARKKALDMDQEIAGVEIMADDYRHIQAKRKEREGVTSQTSVQG